MLFTIHDCGFPYKEVMLRIVRGFARFMVAQGHYVQTLASPNGQLGLAVSLLGGLFLSGEDCLEIWMPAYEIGRHPHGVRHESEMLSFPGKSAEEMAFQAAHGILIFGGRDPNPFRDIPEAERPTELWVFRREQKENPDGRNRIERPRPRMCLHFAPPDTKTTGESIARDLLGMVRETEG